MRVKDKHMKRRRFSLSKNSKINKTIVHGYDSVMPERFTVGALQSSLGQYSYIHRWNSAERGSSLCFQEFRRNANQGSYNGRGI